MEPKEEFMRKAIAIAEEAAKAGDYAIGAVIVKDNDIIAVGKNKLKSHNDPTLHAEIDVIRNACKELSQPYLQGCVLYTTHEPCPMCTSTAIWAKMKGIVFGIPYSVAIENGNKRFSWRQIKISCKEVLEKGEPRLELVESFMMDECMKLFDLNKDQ